MKKILLLITFGLNVLFSTAQNPICFSPAANYATDAGPNAATTADFNNDGYSDVAVANYNATVISVYLGSSSGTLTAAVNYPASYGILSITASDFNNDNKIDLALVSPTGSNLYILMGNGNGSFAAPVAYLISNNLYSVAAGDLNGDSNIDLAVAANGSNNISILTGDGTGTFTLAGTYSVQVNPTFVAISDFNNDGLKDLVVTYSSDNTISILTGLGNATFTTTTEFISGNGHNAVVTKDFNNDGNIDIALPNANTNNVSVFLGNGNATFGAVSLFGTGTTPYNIASTDFNADGKMDLVIPNITSNNVSVLAGNGTGGFAAAINYAVGSGARGIGYGDFNGDGKQDIVATNSGVNSISIIKNGLTVSMNTGFVCQGSGNSYTLNPIGADTYTYSSGSAIVSPTATTNYTITGNTFNGCTNTAVATVSVINCVQASALDFDGVNDMISVPASASLNNLGSTGITLEAWINPHYISGFQSIIMKTGDYTLFLYNGKLIARVWYLGSPNTSFKEYSYPVPLTLNQWTHIAFTWNGTDGKIYINGFDDGANIFATSLSGTETLHIGGSAINGQYINASLDEVRIWNKVRTQCEVNTYMHCEIPSTVLGLVANYHFNQGYTLVGNQAINTLTDASGNSNTGTLNNFTLNGLSSNWVASSGVVSNYTIAAVTPSVGWTSPNVAVCADEPTKLFGTGADYYDWSGAIYDGNNFYPTATETYTVIGYFDATGCTNTAIATITVNPLPIITADGGTICEGQSFTITPSGAITYTISGGDFIVNPTYSSGYTINGTSALGCQSTGGNSGYVVVNVNPNPYVQAIGGQICAGQSFTIDLYGALTYTISGGSNIVSPLVETTYTVSGTDANGCVANAVDAPTITVMATPTVVINSGAICIGSNFIITPSGADYYNYSSGTNDVSPTSNESYTVTGYYNNGCSNEAINTVTVNTLPIITVNSGTICSGQSFTMAPNGAVTYTYSNGTDVVSPTADATYSVSGTDANGCVSSVDAISSVTVNAIPAISVNSGAICAGQSFTMVPTGAVTYTYSNGSDVVMPTADATYSVAGTDANGCVSDVDAISSVTVNDLPIISVSSGAICSGESYTISATGALSYTASPSLVSEVITPTVTVSYTITGTNGNGCVNSNLAISTVTVNELPVLTTSTTNTLLCTGQTATLSVTGAASYTWSTTETIMDIAVTPTTPTTYTVDGMDANGCSNTTTIMQDVSLCTGISMVAEALEATLKVYPNPNNGLFIIDLTTRSQVIVTNALGQVLLTETMESGKHNIDMHNEATGIYFVKVTVDGKQHVIKLIKE